jgi:CDP-diacylglycerol--serine O-phosphatidyltransferase
MTESSQKPDNKVIIQKGIYLLPNLFTLAGLFFGFYSIIASMKGLFEVAALTVFIGMIFDGLDGRVARLTNTQSDFGAQLDSLADMVTFGVAPGILAYSWGLVHLGKVGWLCAFVFTACGALRLARFNVMSDQVDSRYFQGLPIPAGAAIMASLVWAMEQYTLAGYLVQVIDACFSVVTALLMVSNIRYYSFKTFDFRGRVPFASIVSMLFILVAVAIKPDQVLFYAFLLYGLSGPFSALWKLVRRKRVKKPRL